MSSIARPPDPCLKAIILTVQSRARRHFVFHYPPNPLGDNALIPGKSRQRSRPKAGEGPKNTDSSSGSETSSSSDEDEEESQLHTLPGRNVDERERERIVSSSSSTGGGGGGGGATGEVQSQRSVPLSLGSGRSSLKRRNTTEFEDEQQHAPISEAQSRNNQSSSGDNITPPWESLLGLPADIWEKLLSPSRAWHKRRFEMGINDLALIGWPVFVRDDGTWRRKKRKKKEGKSETGKQQQKSSVLKGGGGYKSESDATTDGEGDVDSAGHRDTQDSKRTVVSGIAAERERAGMISLLRSTWKKSDNNSLQTKRQMTFPMMKRTA